ncbi:hypothetical protein [Jeotgalibacillus proteolyticus]|nr:hypothetical protein [Jeotgalibacillus proteolyticus]
MNGIMLLNKHLPLTCTEHCPNFQLAHLTEYVQANGINLAILNPEQVHPYYTIPYALLHDLKKKQARLDCLMMYSYETIASYDYGFSENWAELQSYFKEIRYLA